MSVALATPVDEQGELDRPALARLLDRVLERGVTAVFTTGSTGEGPRLGPAGRRSVLRAVRDHVGGAVPVIPAPSGNTAEEVLEELGHFAEDGADAALVAPPSYFPMQAGETLDYYERLVESTPLPFLVYNIPAMTAVSVPAQVCGELAGRPGVIGTKDSSRDLEYFQEVLEATGASKDFAVLTGTDTMLLASTAAGGAGAVAASANLVPGLGATVYQGSRDGAWEETRSAQQLLHAVVRACRVGSPPAGWKSALEHVGVCSRLLVEPGQALGEAEHRALGRRLAELGVGEVS